MGISFARFNRRENCRSPALFDGKDIAHLGVFKSHILRGAINIAAATAKNRNFGALRCTSRHKCVCSDDQSSNIGGAF